MATTSAQDFLQPALLDRLTDDQRDSKHEVRDQRAMSKARLRAAVLRDLSWLFNAIQPPAKKAMPVSEHAADSAARDSREVDWEKYPHAQKSVLNFGLPALSGRTASTVDINELERAVRQAILDHEPRILADTLRVEATTTALLMDRHNQLSFRIVGKLWAQPMPLELLLQTDIDLETGHVKVRDVPR